MINPKTKLNWSNLTKNKCPNCGKDLLNAYNAEKKRFDCKCGFSIREDKFRKLSVAQVNQKIDEENRQKGQSMDSAESLNY